MPRVALSQQGRAAWDGEQPLSPGPLGRASAAMGVPGSHTVQLALSVSLSRSLPLRCAAGTVTVSVTVG